MGFSWKAWNFRFDRWNLFVFLRQILKTWSPDAVKATFCQQLHDLLRKLSRADILVLGRDTNCPVGRLSSSVSRVFSEPIIPRWYEIYALELPVRYLASALFERSMDPDQSHHFKQQMAETLTKLLFLLRHPLRPWPRVSLHKAVHFLQWALKTHTEAAIRLH